MVGTIRNADSTISFTIRRQPENIPVPYELQGLVTSEKWDFRIMEINKLCAKYSKPLFERIWIVFTLLACGIIPTVLYHVLFNAITPKPLRDAFDRARDNSTIIGTNRFDVGTIDDEIWPYIEKSRWAAFGIFVGLVLVLWTPLILWKYMGARTGRTMATRWAVEDGASGPAFVPKWTIRPPGVWTTDGTVTITIPAPAVPSLFNPNAYMPPYIMQPGQVQAAGMLWAQQQPQQVPYNPEGMTAAPGNTNFQVYATAPAGARDDPFADEKRMKEKEEYDDVKV
ncbi:hypothetical protein DL93DRAFT_2162911 [Clavulina sp. PMI_390]|nr:hypothetical protein DL93DRAFT_2162911 [Clavulina sp. PMI_390]